MELLDPTLSPRYQYQTNKVVRVGVLLSSLLQSIPLLDEEHLKNLEFFHFLDMAKFIKGEHVPIFPPKHHCYWCSTGNHPGRSAYTILVGQIRMCEAKIGVDATNAE